MITYTIVCAGRRYERHFTPDQAVAATLALRDRIELLRPIGFALFIGDDGNVIHLVHREPRHA